MSKNKETKQQPPTQQADSTKKEQLAQLEQELQKTREQADEHFKRLQRAVADYQNFKKQTEAEKAAFIQFANATLLLSLLEILDDLERAVANTPDEILKTEWYKGVLLVRQNFIKKLEKEGIKPMAVIGQKFDPAFHEALIYQPSEEIAAEHIISEAKTGYLLGDKMLRPAQVIVSKGKI